MEEKAKKKTSFGQIIALILLIISFASIAYGVFQLDSMKSLFGKVEEEEDYTSNDNQATTPAYKKTVSELSDAFNNLKDIKGFIDNGMSIEAVAESDRLTINVKADTPYTFIYVLSGNTIQKTAGATEAFFYNFYGVYLATAKAVLDGYDEDEAKSSITSSTDLTMASNGVEIRKTDDGGLIFKLDLGKKINLPDYSNIYVTTEDLEKYSEFIGKSGTVNAKAGKISYEYKYQPTEEDEALIIIAEPTESTNLSYKSLVSFIEYMYGEDEADSFESNYNELENKQFGRYTILLNPEKEEYNTYYENNYKVIELTIKKKES